MFTKNEFLKESVASGK